MLSKKNIKSLNAKNIVSKAIKKLEECSVAEDSYWFWEYALQRSKTFEKQIENCLNLKNIHFSKKPSLIDIGSAPFVLPISLKLSNQFSKITSVDINPYRYKNIEKTGLQIFKIDVDKPNKDLIKEEFDIIYFSHIFEHLRINIIETMNFLKSILKNNGLIYVETPNSYSLKGLYNKIFRGISTGCAGDLYEEWIKIDRLGHMGHVREYSLSELDTFFKKMGFEVVRKGYTGRYQSKSFKTISISIFQTLFPRSQNNIYFILKKLH